MGRMAQTGVQVVALLKAARALSDLHDLCLDPGQERHGTRRIVDRDDIANVDEVCPRGRQDNQLGYLSGLVGVSRAQLGKDFIGWNA